MEVLFARSAVLVAVLSPKCCTLNDDRRASVVEEGVEF